MKRRHWGALDDDIKKEVQSNEIILPMSKMDKFQQIKLPYTLTKEKRIQLKNPFVTQTVEVMNQTEMIQTLIDTYSTKAVGGYMLNPCQLMPTVDFPRSNAADLSANEKITRPFWFVPPTETKFTRGEPKNYAKLSKPVLLQILRKAICGLLRVAGFSEINESALSMLVDGADQYLRLLTEAMRTVLINENRETENVLDIMTLERGFYSITKRSITSLHNCHKEIVNKNRAEIREFKDTFQEYDRLLQENQLTAQNIQKLEDIKDEDYISFLDSHSQAAGGSAGMDGSTINIINFINGETGGGFKEMLDGDLLENNGVGQEAVNSEQNNQQHGQDAFTSD